MNAGDRESAIEAVLAALVLHYLQDWSAPKGSSPGGWPETRVQAQP